MKKIDMVKSVVKTVVFAGVEVIVLNAVSATTPSFGVGILKKVAIGVGSLVLSSMLSEKAAEYACDKVDIFVSEVEKELVKAQ